jgi:YHS domain-containing protein
MKIKQFALIGILAVIAIAAAACGTSTDTAFEKVNKTNDGLALRGYDAVAYFTVGKAVEGNQQNSFVWNGAKWLFSNADNLEKFKANPEAYAPQFGGYCSYAVSNGYTANGDPNAWKIVDGKLYLNYDLDVKMMWEKEQDQRIRKGETNWESFKTKKPEHKG